MAARDFPHREIDVRHDMAGQRRSRSRPAAEIDFGVAQRATQQDGIVDAAQLTGAGMLRGARQHRLDGGRLFPVHRGVYSVGHEAITFHGRLQAAVRAVGPAAAFSFHAAGALLLVRTDPATIDVTVYAGQRRSRPGLRVHHGHLTAADVTRRAGFPVTSPARTLLDLAAVLPVDQLERACIEAVVRRLITADELAAAADAASGRRGIVALRRIAGAGVEPTRSETERAMLRGLAAAGLPRALVNARLGRIRPDFMWPHERLIVETDAWSTHGHPAAFERDRARDAALAAAGWTVLRFTRRRVVDDPLLVTARIAQVLALRSGLAAV
jgi:very-short-patch-repair endonuclease